MIGDGMGRMVESSNIRDGLASCSLSIQDATAGQQERELDQLIPVFGRVDKMKTYQNILTLFSKYPLHKHRTFSKSTSEIIWLAN